MANKNEELQRIIRWYKQVTSKTDVQMRDVARFAVDKGWSLPKPIEPIERLAKQLSRAAREETRFDRRTGRAYRANHSYRIPKADQQLTLWVDIDENQPRKKILKCLVMRREQMVGDALQLNLDAEHWNNEHPNEEPIQLPLDFSDDVEWRKNTPLEDAG